VKNIACRWGGIYIPSGEGNFGQNLWCPHITIQLPSRISGLCSCSCSNLTIDMPDGCMLPDGSQIFQSLGRKDGYAVIVISDGWMRRQILYGISKWCTELDETTNTMMHGVGWDDKYYDAWSWMRRQILYGISKWCMELDETTNTMMHGVEWDDKYYMASANDAWSWMRRQILYGISKCSCIENNILTLSWLIKKTWGFSLG